MEINRVNVDLVIHIPEGHRLTIHGMAGLMGMYDKCIYNMNDNTFIICENEVFDMLNSDLYNLVGVEYDGHMYENNAESNDMENIIITPIDMWDEYTDYVEMAI